MPLRSHNLWAHLWSFRTAVRGNGRMGLRMHDLGHCCKTTGNEQPLTETSISNKTFVPFWHDQNINLNTAVVLKLAHVKPSALPRQPNGDTRPVGWNRWPFSPHRLPGQPLTHSSTATSQANFTHPRHTMTLRFLPQVVCRTKFRGAAIFGTPIFLRSHEPSPLLRVSIYQSKSKLYKAVIFAMILIMFVSNANVLSCLCS